MLMSFVVAYNFYLLHEPISLSFTTVAVALFVIINDDDVCLSLGR